MSISRRIYISLTCLGSIAALFAVLLFVFIARNTELSNTLVRTSSFAANIEKLNALLFAQAADSRGLYLAPNEAEAARMTASVARYVEASDKLVKDWSSSAPEEDRDQMLRLTTLWERYLAGRNAWLAAARLGDIGLAKSLGNNEENRTLRREMNDVVDQLSRTYRMRTDDMSAAIEQLRSTSQRIALVIALSCMTLALTVVLQMRQRLMRPLTATTQALKGLVDGKLDMNLPAHSSTKDEIATLITAAVRLQESLVARRDAHKQEMAAKNAKLQRQEKVDDLIDQFHSVVGNVLQVLDRQAEQMRGSAQCLSKATSLAEGQASDVAVVSHQISANTIQVASAVEEMATGISEIAVQTDAAFGKVNAMAKAALETEVSIRELSAAANKIGAVTGLIKAVADQTNLLSLNATIEAARAGEAGKGFAVVASEVKMLANQTTLSAEEISAVVQSMQAQTQAAVLSINAMGLLASDAQSATAAISAAIQQQQAVSSEIARTIQDTSQGSYELSRNIEGVSKVITKTGESVDDTLNALDDIVEKANRLRTTVDTFLGEVKAA